MRLALYVRIRPSSFRQVNRSRQRLITKIRRHVPGRDPPPYLTWKERPETTRSPAATSESRCTPGQRGTESSSENCSTGSWSIFGVPGEAFGDWGAPAIGVAAPPRTSAGRLSEKEPSRSIGPTAAARCAKRTPTLSFQSFFGAGRGGRCGATFFSRSRNSSATASGQVHSPSAPSADVPRRRQRAQKA